MFRFGQFIYLVRTFIHAHIICKFQEHPIKTEGVMVMITIYPL